MFRPAVTTLSVACCWFQILSLSSPGWGAEPADHQHHHAHLKFSIRSIKSGDWSAAETWLPARVPQAGDRVLIAADTHVHYDVANQHVLRLVQVVGTLEFARDRNTELHVGLLKVQNSNVCSESGFACDFRGLQREGKHLHRPQLLVGTPTDPIPAKHTAKIRLHYLHGMDKKDAPAMVCCGARMEIHGSPLSRTWVKLGASVEPGDQRVTLASRVTGWQVGDEVLVTGSLHKGSNRSFRGEYPEQQPQSETRVITRIDGPTLTLNQPLENVHFGAGSYRSEVANLSRNVSIASADPQGVRGHTLYHRHSAGGISYARFAHLGKEGVLGRYAIHYHLVGESMRGSQVRGVAIVDSHNRWITIHGTQYLIVRDCVGYQSVGHGYFLEDATEAYNLLDRNLGVQAYAGKRLPQQVLPFDPNDGAAFWWTNARNSIVRNVSCENDEYGFRYDCQDSSGFDAQIPLRAQDGKIHTVDVRRVPTFRFEDNEAHTEGLYGMVFAGNRRTEQQRIGPDRQHPHVLRKLKIWQVHYALRPQVPQMLMDDVAIEHAVYGVYRPMFDHHVYRNVRIHNTSGEPFNRALDDDSNQYGPFTVDGLSFVGFYEGGSMPLIQMSDNNVTGEAVSHFRNVQVTHSRDERRRPWFSRGGGRQVTPTSQRDVPYYLHDHFGPGRHAKIVNAAARRDDGDPLQYRDDLPLTGKGAQVAEMSRIKFPQLLDPVDDLPPATVVTAIQRTGDVYTIRGVSHDNGEITRVLVNGQVAQIVHSAVRGGVVDWETQLPATGLTEVTAAAIDAAGNAETHHHTLTIAK